MNRDEFSGLTRDHLIGLVQGHRIGIAAERRKFAEQQARLGALEAVLWHMGEFGFDEKLRLAGEVLARGTPRRECSALVKKYRKENR